MNLVREIVKAYSQLETPKSFWYWSALATISAIVKDNLYLDRGGAFRTYPNIYVMLYADTGLRKGPPIALAKKLVRAVNNTKIISGRSSIQGILKELEMAESLPGGKISTGSKAFIVASEFTSSLVTDPAAMTILTDLYDRTYNEGDYKSLLKSESFSLKDPTITMLVGTNEAHFEDFVGSKDLHGGFIGRMFVIAESEFNVLNPLIRPMKTRPEDEHPDWIKYLKEVSLLKGPFESMADTPAGDLFEKWYLDIFNTIKDQKIKDPTGTIQRIGDTVLKVSMLLSLSQSTNLILSEGDISESIVVCERLIGSIRKTTMGKRGKSALADQKMLIIHELMERDTHSISRQMLSKKYWMHFSNTELDECISSLESAGIVYTTAIGGQIIYTMPEDEFQKFKRHMEGKND